VLQRIQLADRLLRQPPHPTGLRPATLPTASAGGGIGKNSLFRIPLAPQILRQIAEHDNALSEFGGDAEKMRKVCTEKIAHQLNAKPDRMRALEQKVFGDFAMVLSIIPGLPQWTPEDKAGVLNIIAAKAGKTEQRYMRLLQKHQRLRKAILRLGSSIS